MIGIIDYGLGNLSSVYNIFNRQDIKCKIFNNPKEIKFYSKLIFPGVGSFKSGMDLLNEKGWSEKIKESVNNGIPLLGICLGMQLLFSKGEEEENCSGLDLINGTVKKMKLKNKLKLPHVGWNNLTIKQSHYIMNKISNEDDFYFTHSYSCEVNNVDNVVAEFNYGNNFVACIQKKNIFGTQFHPEKSMNSGIKIINNFYNWKV